MAGDRPTGRAHAGRGAATRVPVRWRAAGHACPSARRTVPLAGVVRFGGVILLTWVVFQIGFALAGPSPFVPQLARNRGRDARGAVARRHRPAGSRRRAWSSPSAIAPSGTERRAAVDAASRDRARRRTARHPRDRLRLRVTSSNATSQATRNDPAGHGRSGGLARERHRRRRARRQPRVDGGGRRGGPHRRAVRRRHHRGRSRTTTSSTRRSVITPDGRVVVALRQGAPGSLRRVHAAARLAGRAGRTDRSRATRRRRRHRARVSRHPRTEGDDSRRGRDLVGGVLRQPRRRRDRARRHVHPQPDQRVELHRHDAANATSRIVAAAGDRERTMGRAGRADRVQRVRVARTATSSTAPSVSEQKVIIRTIALKRAARGTRISATRRSSLLVLLVFLVSWIVPGRAWLMQQRELTPRATRVTGPSLTSETCISVRNRPVATVAPGCAQLIDHRLDQRLGVLGPRRVDPTRRRPPLVSPYSVNWLMISTSPRRVGDRPVHHAVRRRR